MSIIFHITSKKEFSDAKSNGQYIHPSLQKENFIHCSQHYQVCEVADFIFKGQKDLILLAINESKVRHEIKYEGPTWNTFPHIYGPINLDSVVTTFDFNESSDGFKLPSPALDLVVENLSQNSLGPLYKDSRHYDAMNGSEGSDVSFYVDQASKKGGDVLDLACGSGRFSLPIAKKGIQVTGLDLSATMLDLAKQKAKKNNLNIDFKLGDIRLFELNKKFDFIFCGFNSSQHLHEEKEFRSFLNCVSQHLKPNGLFVFDIFNPSISMLNRNPSERYLVSKYNDPDDGQEISVWEYPTYNPAKQLSSFRFIYEKNARTLFEEKFSLRNYFPLEIDVLLRNCGLSTLSKFGNYKAESFQGNSMKQIFVCKADK